MALVPRASGDPSIRLVALALAAGVPLSCSLATASGHDHWLDAGEFVALASWLGVGHPPGQPLAALTGATAALFPFGPISFRVALASAVMGAVAAAFLYRAADTTLRALGLRRDRLVVPLALGATWLVTGSYGWWFQTVRPEVYALEAALVAIVIERVVTLEASWPTRDVRPFFQASLALGFALANHHFLALLVLPALAPTLARVYRARGILPLLYGGAACAVGLLTFAYLPLRAHRDPALNLGDPDDLERFFWVVSAQAFQKNTGAGVPQPLDERFLDVLAQLAESLTFAPIVLAFIGAYVLVRLPGARRLAWIWISVPAVFVAARAWLGFVRSNPDALGYLMPAMFATSVLAVAVIGAILAMVTEGSDREPRALAVFVALLTGAVGLVQIDRSVGRASLAGFVATDVFDDALRRDVPARTVLLAHDPGTVFRLYAGAAEEALRPDVTVVPAPFLPYPEFSNRLDEREPDLRGLLRAFHERGSLSLAEAESLAAKRPVLVELDLRVPEAAWDSLAPRGAHYEVLPGGAAIEDVKAGAVSQTAMYERLVARLGPHDLEDPETRARLIYRHYHDALFFARRGLRELALGAAGRGLALAPNSDELRQLDAALRAGSGPLDIGPFRADRTSQ